MVKLKKRERRRRETIKRRQEREQKLYEARLEDNRRVAKWLRANFWVSPTGMVESKHVKAVVSQALDNPNVGNRTVGQCVRFAFPRCREHDDFQSQDPEAREVLGGDHISPAAQDDFGPHIKEARRASEDID